MAGLLTYSICRQPSHQLQELTVTISFAGQIYRKSQQRVCRGFSPRSLLNYFRKANLPEAVTKLRHKFKIKNGHRKI